jgi:hypothetical protein
LERFGAAGEDVDFSLFFCKVKLKAEAVYQQTLEHEALFRGGLRIGYLDVARGRALRRNGVYLKPLRSHPVRASLNLVVPKVEGKLNEHLNVPAKVDAAAGSAVKADYPEAGLGIGRLDGGDFKGGWISGCGLWIRGRRGKREDAGEEEGGSGFEHLAISYEEIVPRSREE